jgi:hypothetical protein
MNYLSWTILCISIIASTIGFTLSLISFLGYEIVKGHKSDKVKNKTIGNFNVIMNVKLSFWSAIKLRIAGLSNYIGGSAKLK